MTISNGIGRLSKSWPRRYRLLVSLNIPKNLFLQVMCRKCIEELLSCNSAIVARFGAVVDSKLNSLQKIENSTYNASAAPLLQSLGWLSS